MFNLVQFIKKQAGDSSLDQEKEKSAALQDMSTNGIKVPKLDTTPAPSSGKSAVHDATSMPSVGRNQSAPKPQKTQKFTKIPRPLAKIAYKRNTGLADSDGLPYTNTDDVILLNKLGYTIDENSYLFLPRGEEREGLYTYIEKNAGVPKDVSRCIDESTAFSAEYLKDMDYSVPKGYEIKGDLCCPVEKTRKKEKESPEKTAAADPGQTILITGHSGAGKSTLGKLLAEKLNLPLQRVDAHPEFKEYVTQDDHGRWQKSLTPGTKEYDFYTDLVHRANKHTIDNSPAAAIIEGSQLGHMSPEELARYKAHILVGGDPEQSIAQRIERSAKKKGVVFSPEEMAEKQEKSKAVVKYWQPGIDKFNKLPGVLKYNHTEHQVEPLIKQLQQLMSKKAEATTPKIVQPNLAPQTAPVINNWNNTGFNINSSKPLALPTLNDGFKHEGEITPRNFLGQVYKNQGAANTEINKATNYALNNKLVPPGRGGAWQPGDGTDNRLDVPVQIYTNPGKGSLMASVKAPPNYATNPDFAGKTLRAFGPDSQHKNVVTVPVVNISDDKALRFGPSAPTGAGNAQKFVADLGQKYTANKNHYLPNVDAKYHNALNNFGDILNNEETAKAIKETGQMPQGFQDSIKQLIPYQNMPGVAPTNNREVLRHEIAHSYNKHQPQHLSPIEGDTGYFKSPQERATGISTIQQDLYNSIGSRAESPEQFKSNISRFLTAPDMERAMDEGGLKDNSKRYLRYLKQSPVQEKVLENDAFIAPAFVQNSTAVPTLKTAEATHELKSSNIKAVGYNKENKSLDVAFHSGGNYTYKDVPKSLFDRIKRVKSPGKFFHKHIKRDNPYSYERIEKESEYKLHWSKDLHKDVTNNRHYPFSFLTGEAKELVDAIKNRDWANFKEEIGDSTYAAQMLAAQATGLNHPVYADLSKHYDREKVWKDMFKEKGSSYHPKHMQGGSNYAKASKIIKAFASAGIKVDQREAERLANKYTGGKMEKEAHNMIPAPGTVTNLEAYQEPAPSRKDMLGALILGDAYIPTPRNQESMLEAKQRNRRNIDMGYLDTDTAKALGEKISPFIGGNPIKARLDLERMQQNPNIMSQFKQANSILDKMQNKIYKEISNAK
jgi:NTP pyrophosphatase (non-canonical NTP hydrolase)/cytidylate kinase